MVQYWTGSTWVWTGSARFWPMFDPNVGIFPNLDVSPTKFRPEHKMTVSICRQICEINQGVSTLLRIWPEQYPSSLQCKHVRTVVTVHTNSLLIFPFPTLTDSITNLRILHNPPDRTQARLVGHIIQQNSLLILYPILAYISKTCFSRCLWVSIDHYTDLHRQPIVTFVLFSTSQLP